MGDYRRSLLSPGRYGNSDGTNSDKITAFNLACEFLDALRTVANVLDDADTTTLNPYSPIPSSQPNHRPINANRVNDPSGSRDRGCQSQWHLPLLLIQKVEIYWQNLQRCPRDNASTELQGWLAKYPHSMMVRDVGLRILKRISQNSVSTDFHELLCAMIVQHACLGFMPGGNPLEKATDSAFIEWADINPTIRANEETLDVVFERITSSDRPSLRGVRPAQPSFQAAPSSSSVFFGMDRSFALPDSYPMSVPDTALYGVPTNAQRDYNQNTDLWKSSLYEGLVSHPDDTYSIPQPPSSYPPLAPDNFQSYSSNDANTFFTSAGCHYYPLFQNRPQPVGPNQLYGLSQHLSSPRRRNQMSLVALNQSAAFNIVTRLIDKFMSLDGLGYIFIRTDVTLIPPNGLFPYAPTHNSLLTYITSEASFFNPLRAAVRDDPVAQAIVSTARWLTSQGVLRSFADAAEYVIHLGANLLPSSESFRGFAGIVLQICYRALDGATGFISHQVRDPDDDPERRLNWIVERFHGTHHPAHLLRPRPQPQIYLGVNQGLQPGETSPASSNLLTPSSPVSSRRRGRSVSDNITVTSTSSRRTANTTPSESSTKKCEECDKTYTGKNAVSHLSRHKRGTHGSKRSTSCPQCGKVFSHTRTDNVRMHCRKVHGLELPKDGREFWASQSSNQQGS
ncbi:hypothetical protein AAE478_009469 [Parahypoxylon ruwenzoriense]